MSAVNLINAIPSILQFVEDTADIDAIREERHEYKHRANIQPARFLLMAFPYEQMVEYEVGDGSALVLIRDVVNLPEFQQRLANILGTPNHVHCEIHEVERDLKVGPDGDVDRDDAIVTFTFSRWNNHPVKKSGCLFVGGFEDPNDHNISANGVCHCCGSYK